MLPQSVARRAVQLGLCLLVTSGCAATSSSDSRSPAASATEASIEAVADPADEQILFERVRAERQEREHGALHLANDEPQLQSAVRAIRAGAPPLPVLRTAMERFAESESSEVVGWAVEAEDLQVAPIPSAFLSQEEAMVALVVIRYRAPHLPRYSIVYLLIQEGRGPTLEDGSRAASSLG